MGIRNPPCAREHRERTLPDRSIAKWCGLCESMTDHYRTGNLADNPGGDEGAVDMSMDVINDGGGGEDGTKPSLFARLRDACFI